MCAIFNSHAVMQYVCLFQTLVPASKMMENIKPTIPSGANYPNLFVIIPKLPIPEKLQMFLLFDVDINQEPPPPVPISERERAARQTNRKSLKEAAAEQGINWWDPDMDPPGKHFSYDY